MGVRLPAEYQEVEYLESTGDQYCLTDVLYHVEIDSEAVFMPTDSSQDSVLFGCAPKHQGAYDRWFVANFGWYQKRLQYFYGDYKYFDVGTSGNRYKQTVNTKYHAISSLKNGSQTMIINGQTLLEEKNTLPVVTPIIGYISLFAHNNPSATGGAPEYGSKYKGRIYSLKLLSDGELLGDFVPCVRKADNKPGIYNLVTGGFFVNQGTGEFLVGPDVIDSISPLMVAWRRGLIASSGNARPIRLEHGGLNGGLPSNGPTDLAYRARSIRCAAVMRGKTYTFNVQQTAGISVYFATWTYDDADGLSPVTNSGWFAAGEPFTPDRDFVKILISINGPGATNKRINLDELVNPEIQRVFN